MPEAREQPAWKVFAKWFHDHWGDDELPPDEPSHEWQSLEAAFASAGLAVVPVEPTEEILTALVLGYKDPTLDEWNAAKRAGVNPHAESEWMWVAWKRAMIAAALPPLASGGG